MHHSVAPPQVAVQVDAELAMSRLDCRRLGGSGKRLQAPQVDCLMPVSHASGEEQGRGSQHYVRPVVEWRERRHVAIATDQDEVSGEKRVWDGFRALLVCCGVVAGLWPVDGLADDTESLQLLLKVNLGGCALGQSAGSAKGEPKTACAGDRPVSSLRAVRRPK